MRIQHALPRLSLLCAIDMTLPCAMTVVQSKGPEVISKGSRFEIKSQLKQEGDTIVLFFQDTSVMEHPFLADLEKQAPSDQKLVRG